MTSLSANTEVESADGAPEALRIAVVGPRGVPSNYSGVERIVEEMFEIIAAQGHHVTVYCRPGVLDAPTGVYKGMRLVRAPAPGGKNFETLTHSLFSTLHLITNGDVHDGGKPFDVISYHTIAPGLFTPLAKWSGIPVINHVHGLDWQREKWRGWGSRMLRLCERTMVKNASRIIAVNNDIVDYYRTQYGAEAVLSPNGVLKVSDDFTPDGDTLKKFGLTSKGYAVSICRLVPEKRLQDLISAFGKVPGDIKLVFVGEGKHSPEYVEQIRRQAAGDSRIVFTGLQQGQALETLFRCARLYLTASELEGLPSSLLEAMERRIPVIASDITPHRQLLEKVSGYDWFFPVGDVQALSQLMNAALANEAKAQYIGQGERDFVRANYAWPVLAAATLRHYRDVVGQRAVRRV
jgi:glycosyltransferase involved in cell wall biosynthesis